MDRKPLQVRRLNEGKPLIEPSDLWWETGVTFNAGAVLVQDKRIIRSLLPMLPLEDSRLADGVVAVLYRARPETDPVQAFTRSFIGLAVFTPQMEPLYRWKEPVLLPEADPQAFDALGVEDPRITFSDGQYQMIYCGVQADAQHVYKAALCLATSSDLVHWEKKGPLSGDINGVNNKDGALFPQKIGGKYLLLHRPYWPGLAQKDFVIHLAESDSVEGPWVDLGEMMRAPQIPEFRESWLGAGSVPEPAGEGKYVMVYHTGNFRQDGSREYDLDAAFLDFAGWDGANPQALVRRRLEHLMRPETPAELRSGSQHQVSNVLFTCGSYRFGEDLVIVYGGADSYTLAAAVNWEELVNALT